MAYTALYRAFRPKTFAEVVGQEHIKTTLKNQIKTGRVGHAYLLNGTRGTGKTSIAKILARAVNCENPKGGEPCNECEICKAILEGSLTDVVEMDAASNNSVEDIREIRNEVNFLPTRAKYRIYIIDEVHMLSTGAFNALLKTLEEPPEHVKFILATTEPQKLPATILSRCQRFDFKKIPNEDISKRLKLVCEKNKVEINEDALNLIAVLSEGAMRDALSILERCIQDGESKIDIDKIKDLVGIPKLTYINNTVEAIIDSNVEKAIEQIDNVINEGKDLTNFLWEMIKYTKDILVTKIGKKLQIYSNEEIQQIKKIADRTSKDRLLNIILKLSEMENKVKQSSQKIIIFQTGIINLCVNEETKSLDERIKALENKIQNGIANSITTIPIKTNLNKEKDTAKNNIQAKTNTEIDKSPSVGAISNRPLTVKEERQKKDIEPNIQTSNLKSQEFWPNILQQLKQNGKLMLYANLINSRAVELNDMTIGIEFSSKLNDFRRQLLEKNENLQEVEKLVSIACGKEMQIKYLDKPKSKPEKNIKMQETQTEQTKNEMNKEKSNSINSLEDLADLGIDINYIDE